MKIGMGVIVLSLSGCCAMPNAVRTELEHVSHASQHWDGAHQNMGAQVVAVQAHWQKGGAYLNMSEGYNLSASDGHRCDGGLCGNREIFQAAVGYEWRVKP